MDSLSTVLLSLALAAGIGALLVPAMPRIKGRIGEWLVHHRLRSALPAAYYTIFNDVRIRRSGAAGSAVMRLDHVVVSPYGIFVIRSRHWSGWLFGTERDAEWTRLAIRSRRRVSNPLRESLAGVDALCGLLDLEPGLFHPMVVLTGGAEFRTPLPPNVTPLGGMLPFIQVRNRETLGFEAAQQAARRIESGRLRPGPQTRAAQLAELRREQRSRFSPRQATSALACMLAMVSVAGLLIQNLAEMPGRFPSDPPGQRVPTLGSAPPPRIELPVAGEAGQDGPECYDGAGGGGQSWHDRSNSGDCVSTRKLAN